MPRPIAPRLPSGLVPALLSLLVGLRLGGAWPGMTLAPVLWIAALRRNAWAPVALAFTLGVLLATPPAPGLGCGAWSGQARLELGGRIAQTQASLERGRWIRLSTSAAGPGQWPEDFDVFVAKSVATAERLRPGARVEAVVRLRPQGRARGAPRRADALSLRVVATGSGLGAALAELRDRAADVLDRQLKPGDAGLARALLLGGREALARADRDRFRATGQGHLLAVSGVHVGLMVAMVALCAASLGLGRRARALLALLVTAVYVPLVGAPPSALRAGLAIAAHEVSVLLDRRTHALAILVWVVLLILVASPQTHTAVALHLSVAAVCAILLLAPRLGAPWGQPALLPNRVRPRGRAWRTALAVSVAAHIGTAPWLAQHLQQLCLWAPLVALPAVPLTALLVGSGFALLLLEPIEPLTQLAGWAFGFSADLLRAWLDLAQACGVASLDARAPGPVGWALHACGYALLLRGRVRTGLFLQALLHAGLVFRAPPAASYALPARLPPYHAARMPEPVTLDLDHLLATWPVALGLLAFAVVSVRPLKWLTPGGAAAAFVLGLSSTLILRTGALAALLAPFVVATLLGKLPRGPRHGARSFQQVFANGAPCALGLLLALLGAHEAGLLAFLGGLSCLGADTCATEVGLRYGRSPFRLAGKRPLRAGESGAVTWAGLLASLAGAWLAPVAYATAQGTWSLAPYVAAAGFAGGLLDSVLGATVQFRGRDPLTGQPTESLSGSDGKRLTRLSGWSQMGNDSVNLASGLVAALLAVALYGLGAWATSG